MDRFYCWRPTAEPHREHRSSGALCHVLCRFGAYLDDGFCLLVKRVQLLTHKVSLNFDEIFQTLGLTKVLDKSNSSRNVFRRIAQKLFVQLGVAPR